MFLSLFPDSSSVSEKRRPPVVSAESRRPEAAAAAATPAPAPERRERLTPAALRRNPSLRRELRPALELALAEKLEDLGLRPVCCAQLRSSEHLCLCNVFVMMFLRDPQQILDAGHLRAVAVWKVEQWEPSLLDLIKQWFQLASLSYK